MVQSAVKETLSSSKNKMIFGAIFFASLFLYIIAINTAGSLDVFFNHTPVLMIITQLFFIILNSLLTAIVITMTLQVMKKRQDGSGTFLQSTLALIFSVGTTGCYICGSLLVPASGIMASFVALPLRGLEVKILTVLLLLYVLYDISKKYFGICEIKKDKSVSLDLGIKSITLNTGLFSQFKPFIISFLFIIVVIALPIILPTDNTAAASSACPSKIKVSNVDLVE